MQPGSVIETNLDLTDHLFDTTTTDGTTAILIVLMVVCTKIVFVAPADSLRL